MFVAKTPFGFGKEEMRAHRLYSLQLSYLALISLMKLAINVSASVNAALGDIKLSAR